jgi:hypothetical protein
VKTACHPLYCHLSHLLSVYCRFSVLAPDGPIAVKQKIPLASGIQYLILYFLNS